MFLFQHTKFVILCGMILNFAAYINVFFIPDNSLSDKIPTLLRSSNHERKMAFGDVPSLPISTKRSDMDGLSMAANRFKIAYPTIARAELLSLEVPLPPQDDGGSVKIVEYSEETFKREILNGVPVLFKNFYKNGPIDVHHVRDTVGDMKINVKTGNYGDPNYGNGDERFYANNAYKTTMKDYIDTVIDQGVTHNNVIPYAGNLECDKKCEEKMMGKGNYIQFPFYEKLRPTAKFWVSKAGTLTPLHRDTADNLIVQLGGRKSWTLFPIRKDVADRLYYNPSPVPGIGSERSLVNITNPDLTKFPAFDGMMEEFAYKVNVDAGDMLFLPVGWGHEVYTVTDSVMLNYWTSQPKSIYEHVCYTIGCDSGIMDLVYSADNVEHQHPGTKIMPVSGLKMKGNKENGLHLKDHQPISEEFSLIFDVQLPEGSSGRLVSKVDDNDNTNYNKVYWSLVVNDCNTIKFDYTTINSPTIKQSMEWKIINTNMCDMDKHRIIVSVNKNEITFTIDQETSGIHQLVGLIDDCEQTSTTTNNSCTLKAGEIQMPEGMPEGTEGRILLGLVHREKAL